MGGRSSAKQSCVCTQKAWVSNLLDAPWGEGLLQSKQTALEHGTFCIVMRKLPVVGGTVGKRNSEHGLWEMCDCGSRGHSEDPSDQNRNEKPGSQ